MPANRDTFLSTVDDLGEYEQRWADASLGITNYVTLLDQLRRTRTDGKPVLLVTFNYDELLERALVSVGLTIGDLPQYVGHETFKLYKLHGSIVDAPAVNMTWSSPEVTKELIENAPSLKISDVFRMAPAAAEGNKRIAPSLCFLRLRCQ